MATIFDKKKYEILLKKYQGLNSDEIRILQALAACWRRINQTDLKNLLETLRWRDQKGEPLWQLVDKAWRKKMEDLKLLSVKQGRFHLDPLLSEPPARRLAMDGKYKEVWTVVESMFPLPRDFWNSGSDYTEEQIKLRHALLSGNESEVLKLLKLTGNPWTLSSHPNMPDLESLCLEPFELDWVEQLPDTIKFQALGSDLMNAMLILGDRTRQWELARQWFPHLGEKHRGPKQVLAAKFLCRGELEPVPALLREDGTSTGLSLKGWLLCLQGEYEQAHEVFEEALRAVKKETRKRNVFIAGLPGIYQKVCQLRHGSTEALKGIYKQLEFMQKQEEDELELDSVCILFAIAARILLGERNLSHIEGTLKSLTNRNEYVPYVSLFGSLLMMWLGKNPPVDQLKYLSLYSGYAQAGGYAWYVREAELIIEKCSNKKSTTRYDELVQKTTWTPITELLTPKQSWELALDALKMIGEANSVSENQTTTGALRMIWRLQLGSGWLNLEPREQKMKSNGQWTAGRPVALKKLYDAPESFPYLTDHDRRLCRAISAEAVSSYYGYYVKNEYYLSGDQAILAAVGHPLIFRENDLEHPLEVVVVEPTLQILEEKGALLIRIEPWPKSEEAIVIQEEGLHRIRVCRFDEQHRKIASILGSKGLKVPTAARDRVLESIAEIAPILTVHSNIGGVEGGQAETVLADSRPVLRLRPVGDGLSVELFFRPIEGSSLLVRPGEGGKTLFAEVEGRQVCATRNEQAEQAAVKALLERCPTLGADADWSWRLDDLETALETLLDLQKLGDSVVLEWPEGKAMRIAAEAGVSRFKVGVHRQRDWFSLDGGLELDDGKLLEMSQLLSLLDHSPGRFVRLEDGDFVCLTRNLRNRLDALRSYGDGGKFHPLTAPAMEEVLEGMQVTAVKPWKDLLRKVNEARDLRPEVPSTLRGELREYQVEGFHWLARLAHWGAGACLADDMGLGKTIQALALILSRAKQGPTLILAPTSVCINWMEETARFAPSLRPLRFGPGDREQMLSQAGPFDLIVCSYGLLQTESGLLAGVEWSTVVADEAQAIKNIFTKRSRAAMTLPAGFKMITTGTPIENHLGELWNLFHFINPGLLGSLDKFNRKFAAPIEQNRDAEAKRRLKGLIRPFILRRLKSEVLAELPSRTEVVLLVELSAQEAALYEALRQKALEKMAEPEDQPGQQRIKVLAEIMRLRRACCHPELVMPGSGIGEHGSAKLQAFGEILDDLLENRHQALVFSQFVDHLQLVRSYLDSRKVRYQYLDGSTPIKKRQEAVNAFQAGEGDLFLISLKAGGFGLNLTAADYVIHMDPWWNPAVEEQASDRAHRIGQQRPVTIYRLVTRGTIEEKILALHQHKRDLATSLLDGTDSGTRLSLEEMLELIRGEV